MLGVPQALLDEHGAVSEPVARAMARASRAVTGADYGISVTGVAGPDSDERGNAVGTVTSVLLGLGRDAVPPPPFRQTLA